MKTVFRKNEAERLKALRRYQILDTPPEPAFDRIAEMAANLFQVPMAAVSLVDQDRGASYLLGVSEWLFGLLIFLGFWNKKLGIIGAAGSCASFVSTVTIIPFMPDGWDASAGGFPAMTGNVPFLMKDVVLLAASFYLLKQDLMRVSVPTRLVTGISSMGPEEGSSFWGRAKA